METERVKEIVGLVRLNINFLVHFMKSYKNSPNQNLSTFYTTWTNRIKQNKNYNLSNQGIYLTSLYGLFLYPQQVFFDNIPEIELDKLDKSKWGNSQIIIWNNQKKTLKNYTKRIRNALSHGRVYIDEKCNFTFEDKKNKDSSIDFKIIYNQLDLRIFIDRFCSAILFDDWSN